MHRKEKQHALDVARAIVMRQNVEQEFICPSNEDIRSMARLLMQMTEVTETEGKRTIMLQVPEAGFPEVNSHLMYLPAVLADDFKQIIEKDIEYAASWKKRGGIGAFMMLARKWDRIEPACERNKYDILSLMRTDARAEGVGDDVRDLRRYLALCEAEVRRSLDVR